MKLAATLALLLALTATATAGPTRKAASRKATTAAKAQPAAQKPAKNYDFLGDEIDGDRIMPDGTTVFGLPDAKRPSLIKLRGDFVKEIARSAEQL
ncbi:MAG TPA: hypothetical protein VMZ28_00500 [Kofleriaceae bacterium]|nr:hypothetical protein [Kofleriaceae bacterium]